MDHALVAEDAEEAGDEGQDVDQAQEAHPDQELLLLRLELQGFQVVGEQRGEGGRGW